MEPKSSRQEYDHSYQHSCECHDVRFKTKPGSPLPSLFLYMSILLSSKLRVQ